ncbi:MAG: ATP synthase F1 subunit gamma [Lentisphaerae bacterium]|nr:ATP synthase F1 subunit gamma [Lentisphaerota bacterium]
MANSLREIKRRLVGVRKISQITRAMKMVAGVKFRRAQATLLGSRPYPARLKTMVGRLNPRDVSHPLLRRANTDSVRALIVVVSSDRGLCGSFNSTLFRLVRQHLEQLPPAQKPSLFLIGRKAADHFKRLAYPVLDTRIHVTSPFAEEKVEEIAALVIQAFAGGRFDEVHVFFNEFKTALQQKPTRELLLPVALETAGGKAAEANLIFETDPAELCDLLLRRYVASQLRRAIVESNAAEQGARMAMMDQANRNAMDVIDTLRLSFNKARQVNITREIADITTGAEAMA